MPLRPDEHAFLDTIWPHQVLYDKTADGYRDKSVKEVAWNAAASRVGMSVPNVMQKWRTVRAKVVNYVKSRAAFPVAQLDLDYERHRWLFHHLKPRTYASGNDLASSDFQARPATTTADDDASIAGSSSDVDETSARSSPPSGVRSAFPIDLRSSDKRRQRQNTLRVAPIARHTRSTPVAAAGSSAGSVPSLDHFHGSKHLQRPSLGYDLDSELCAGLVPYFRRVPPANKFQAQMAAQRCLMSFMLGWNGQTSRLDCLLDDEGDDFTQ